MTKHQLAVYDSYADLETAVEALDDTVSIDIVPFMEYGKQKFMLRQPGGS